MKENIIQVDSHTFKETVESSLLTLVDFYADWCGPCRIIAPSVEKLAEEYGDRVKFVKVNIDENPSIAMQYRVKSIPTLMILRKGKPIRTMIGASSFGHYRGELQKVVSKTLAQ